MSLEQSPGTDSKIKAAPTKDFFIGMLTRDIKLERAIIDLIDNSIDGAKALRGEKSFDGLYIELVVNKTEFIIMDNCGGFSIETATNYAFMFGRPDAPEHGIKNSVGRFGVGMKRALFKMGNQFEVESQHKDEHFQVDVNVKDWSSRPDDWFFDYKLINTNTSDLSTSGTYIRVCDLNYDVSEEFDSDNFITGLQDEIERTLSFFLSRGIKITLNDQPLKVKSLNLLESEFLKPYEETFHVKDVKIKVICGIGKANPDLAGWYIYCNDRLVLEKDKTTLTGWDGFRINAGVQKFHHIYAMFRGVVFFTSEDSKSLPMTTTKTGIDANSTAYRAARMKMVGAMQQVMTFLKTFNSDQERDELYESSIETEVIALKNKTYEKRFIAPAVANFAIASDNKATISFKTDKQVVDSLKNYFNVTSNKECGEKLLSFFMRMEGENI